MACVDRILDFGLNNLRRIGNNVISGPTIEGQPHLISKIKDAGIRTIIDFRAEATPLMEKECQDFGLKYFKIGMNHTLYEHKPLVIPQDFSAKLKEFFRLINKGYAYIGCRYGIDRTNSALLFNYFLNPQSSKFLIPRMLPGTFELCMDIDNTIKKRMPKELINTINRTIRKVQQSIKHMTPSQRAELGIPESRKERFTKLFKDKIGKLIKINSDPNYYYYS